MSTTTIIIIFPSLLAQEAGPADLGARLAGLAAQAGAGLALIAVSAIGAVLIWQLLVATVKNPSPEKLAMIVAVALVAVFFVGAAPSMIDAAYAYRQSFLR